MRPLGFYNARIVDGDGRGRRDERPHPTGRNGRITAVGNGPIEIHPGDPVVDLAGRTVMPGMVNAHGHVGDTRGLQTGAQFYTEANLLDQLRRYASYGVTTVMSLGGDGEAGIQASRRAGDARARSRAPLCRRPDRHRDDGRGGAQGRRPRRRDGAELIKIRVDDNLGASTKMPLEAAPP